jgi:hypothetical protein
MAVGAHRFTPFDLGQHEPLAAEAHEVADVSALLHAGWMVEGHRGVVHAPATVGARERLLQRAVPAQELDSVSRVNSGCTVS